MIINRKWEMPNKNTFDIRCIKELIKKYHNENLLSIDPFANKNRICKITNDIIPEYGCDYSIDALQFLKMFETNSVDFILNDPPYSNRQVSECYKKVGRTVNMETTQSRFWSLIKKEISRILKPNGYCISFGWNSNGIEKTNGFSIVEILIVAHGGHHNDTICVVEQKNDIFF